MLQDILTNTTFIRICQLYLIAFNILIIIYRRSKDDISSVCKEVRSTGVVAVIGSRKQPVADFWRDARFNSWGVFASTVEGTIVIFDIRGKPIAEVCFLSSFKKFYVDEKGFMLIDDSSQPKEYLFSDLRWFATKRPFSIPDKTTESEIKAVLCKERSLRVIYAKGSKSFHYFCILPKWALTTIIAVVIGLFILDGICILLGFINAVLIS